MARVWGDGLAFVDPLTGDVPFAGVLSAGAKAHLRDSMRKIIPSTMQTSVAAQMIDAPNPAGT